MLCVPIIALDLIQCAPSLCPDECAQHENDDGTSMLATPTKYMSTAESSADHFCGTVIRSNIFVMRANFTLHGDSKLSSCRACVLTPHPIKSRSPAQDAHTQLPCNTLTHNLPSCCLGLRDGASNPRETSSNLRICRLVFQASAPVLSRS